MLTRSEAMSNGDLSGQETDLEGELENSVKLFPVKIEVGIEPRRKA